MAFGIQIEFSQLIITTLCGVLFSVFGGCSKPSDVLLPEAFSSPEEAAIRLESVIEKRDVSAAQKLFGPDGEYLLSSGDETLDRQRGDKFVQAFNESHAFVNQDENTFILRVGRNGWPFPVPLVKNGNNWLFDANAGRDEILARRVGENELRAMSVCRAVVHAQKVYVATKIAEKNGAKRYAAKLFSSDGLRDGLYWPTAENERRSPLGKLVAEATAEGYSRSPLGEPKPYYGYLFKLLTSEPTRDYPLGRFWFVAYPVTPGETGVMSFAINERGYLYEQLAPDNFANALDVSAGFDLDTSWSRVE